MRVPRDFYVKDDYGVIWNTEPFPNRKEANGFRDMLKKELNSIRFLDVISFPRGAVTSSPLKIPEIVSVPSPSFQKKEKSLRNDF